MRTHCHLPLVLALAIAPPLAAQDVAAGSATFQITTQVAASSQAAAVVGNDLTMQITVMTDGHRVAMDVVPGSMSTIADGSGRSIKTIFTPGSRFGACRHPPSAQMAAMAGGGPGMRIDVSLATIDSAIKNMSGNVDSSMRHAMDSVMTHIPRPEMHSLGTTSTVAGLQCENWVTIATADTVLTCVIPTPPALLAIQNQVKTMSGLGALFDQIPGMANCEKNAYGGRPMTTIRTIDTKRGMHMEMTSFTPGAPDATQMELPAGLPS